MKNIGVLPVVLSLFCVAIGQAVPTVAQVTHSEFQAVNTAGEQRYNRTEKVTLEGIIVRLSLANGRQIGSFESR